MIQTGLRVSELTTLRICAMSTSPPPHHVRVTGKGRKRRAVTLTRETAATLRRLAHRTPRPARGPAVPHPPGDSAQPRRRRTAHHQHTQPPRRRAARRFRPNASPRTCSATPTRCSSKPTTSTSPRSPSGSDTKASQTTHIYQHADPALKEASDRQHRPARHQTRPIPTHRHDYSPSSKPCDYAEQPNVAPASGTRASA